MVVDSSALIAILLKEYDAKTFTDALEQEPFAVISSATLVEASAVALGRGGPALLTRLNRLVSAARLSIRALTADQAELAVDAYRRYGRGVGLPACLNFGDCFSYALAASLDCPLLYKGEDFALTDIRSAL